MAGYGILAVGPAVSRAYARRGADTRSIIGLELVARIEGEHSHWHASGERHPADDSADAAISRLRSVSGAVRMLAA
jgi:hypothetical protein